MKCLCSDHNTLMVVHYLTILVTAKQSPLLFSQSCSVRAVDTYSLHRGDRKEVKKRSSGLRKQESAAISNLPSLFTYTQALPLWNQ